MEQVNIVVRPHGWTSDYVVDVEYPEMSARHFRAVKPTREEALEFARKLQPMFSGFDASIVQR